MADVPSDRNLPWPGFSSAQELEEDKPHQSWRSEAHFLPYRREILKILGQLFETYKVLKYTYTV